MGGKGSGAREYWWVMQYECCPYYMSSRTSIALPFNFHTLLPNDMQYESKSEDQE